MTPLNAPSQHSPVVDYLDYFGLYDDPFSADLKPFYDGGSRRELFAELLHLCQFSAGILVVLGEEGVGKANLKAALCEQFAEQDKIIEFSVPVLCSDEQVLHAIALQLGIDVDAEDFNGAGINQTIAVIRELIHNSEDDDCLKVVMVENAHHLDEASLKVLLRLSAPGEQNPYKQLHTLLFADSTFAQRVEQIENQALLQVFELPALTPAEMKHYLRFRLDAVGFSGIFPFKDPDIQFLWDISKGIPGKFHDAAREILIELALPPPETKSLGMPPAHMAAVVLLLAGLLMVFFYQNSSDDESTDELAQLEQEEPDNSTPDIILLSDEQPGQSEPGAGLNDIVEITESTEVATEDLASKKVQIEAPKPSAAEIEKPLQIAKGSPPKPNPTTKLNEAEVRPAPAKVGETKAAEKKNADSSVAETTAPEAKVAKTNVDERRGVEKEIEALVAAAEKELVAETPKNGASTTNSSALTADENALLDQAPDNFTLQVLAGGSRAAVDDFIRRQSNREDLAVFTANRNGKTLYIVVMGSFPSSNAARLAVQQLPPEQKKAGPWPRSLQSVQAEIRQFRGF